MNMRLIRKLGRSLVRLPGIAIPGYQACRFRFLLPTTYYLLPSLK
jgi:hypothetical protein